MMETEDTILIENILNGDKKSEKELYTKYSVNLFKYIKHKYPSNHEIEDDVSDILIKIFNKLSTFDLTKGSFKTWVFCVAKNHMIDKFRLSNNENATISIDSFDYNSISTNNINNFYVNNTCDYDNKDMIDYVSSKLNSHDFKLLNMKYVQGFNYNEIGAEFNVTSTTVSNRVNYLKSKLKNKIKTVLY